MHTVRRCKLLRDLSHYMGCKTSLVRTGILCPSRSFNPRLQRKLLVLLFLFLGIMVPDLLLFFYHAYCTEEAHAVAEMT
jgi:hypothetical protein